MAARRADPDVRVAARATTAPTRPVRTSRRLGRGRRLRARRAVQRGGPPPARSALWRRCGGRCGAGRPRVQDVQKVLTEEACCHSAVAVHRPSAVGSPARPAEQTPGTWLAFKRLSRSEVAHRRRRRRRGGRRTPRSTPVGRRSLTAVDRPAGARDETRGTSAVSLRLLADALHFRVSPPAATGWLASLSHDRDLLPLLRSQVALLLVPRVVS